MRPGFPVGYLWALEKNVVLKKEEEGSSFSSSGFCSSFSGSSNYFSRPKKEKVFQKDKKPSVSMGTWGEIW